MDLFYVLLILLVVSKVFGELAERAGQPALVGELIAGITLGMIVAEYPGMSPDLVGLTHSEVFRSLTDLGMFFLMLAAGIEMQPHKIFQHSAGALVVALGGMLVPLGLGIGLGLLFLPDSALLTAQCLFLGTALAITAVPATVRILMDLNQFDTEVGQTIVSAAVFDDILSLLLLAWLTGLISAGEPGSAAGTFLLIGKITLYFLVTGVIGVYVFPWGGHFLHHLKTRELEISAILVGAFAFAVFAEFLDLHFIVGAFIAGLYFGQNTIDEKSYDRVKNTIFAMTFGFLAPIFFVSIGLHLNLDALTGVPLFVLILIVVAFLGKIVGAGGAARAFGFPARESITIGIGMSPRGAVELVIAGIALEAGLFDGAGADNPIVDNLFSSVVIMAVVTTVISPIMLQRAFRSADSNRHQKDA